MKNRFQLLLVFLVLFLSCNYSSNKKQETVLYEKEGLSFQLPKYWKVEKDRAIEGVLNSRFLSVSNKEPLSGDEFFVITAIDSGKSLSYIMDVLIKQSSASYAKRNMDFGLLTQAKAIKIGSRQALRSTFETKLIGSSNKGTFTVFNHANKTFSFISSAETKNIKENTAVVDSVIKSLKMK
ncbi:MAG: hypothetical protein EOP00_24390 [Pedobacter sp.]|nr:MAG: hypothetical protein EOP00_24390 [Pedobacter sp.]